MSATSLVEVTTTNILLVASLVKLLEQHGALPRGAYAAELDKALTNPATRDKLSGGAKTTLEHMLTLLQSAPAGTPAASQA